MCLGFGTQEKTGSRIATLVFKVRTQQMGRACEGTEGDLKCAALLPHAVNPPVGEKKSRLLVGKRGFDLLYSRWAASIY